MPSWSIVTPWIPARNACNDLDAINAEITEIWDAWKTINLSKPPTGIYFLKTQQCFCVLAKSLLNWKAWV
jgi:hypothetical protein